MPNERYKRYIKPCRTGIDRNQIRPSRKNEPESDPKNQDPDRKKTVPVVWTKSGPSGKTVTGSKPFQKQDTDPQPRKLNRNFICLLNLRVRCSPTILPHTSSIKLGPLLIR